MRKPSGLGWFVLGMLLMGVLVVGGIYAGLWYYLVHCLGPQGCQ